MPKKQTIEKRLKKLEKRLKKVKRVTHKTRKSIKPRKIYNEDDLMGRLRGAELNQMESKVRATRFTEKQQAMAGQRRRVADMMTHPSNVPFNPANRALDDLWRQPANQPNWNLPSNRMGLPNVEPIIEAANKNLNPKERRPFARAFRRQRGFGPEKDTYRKEDEERLKRGMKELRHRERKERGIGGSFTEEHTSSEVEYSIRHLVGDEPKTGEESGFEPRLTFSRRGSPLPSPIREVFDYDAEGGDTRGHSSVDISMVGEESRREAAPKRIKFNVLKSWNPVLASAAAPTSLSKIPDTIPEEGVGELEDLSFWEK